MNERIKKLKEQATSYTWNGNDVTEELDEQKFAELIVRECIDNVKVWEKDSRNHISYMLKRQYGVEE